MTRAVTTRPDVVVHRDADTVAAAAAARLTAALADAQAARGTASIALTGGTLGIAVLACLRETPARHAVDWSSVDVWWGDERFVPRRDPQRNELQAREALLDLLDLDPARVHPMPASDGPEGDDVDAAAARHAAELMRAGEGAIPQLDLVLLGMGPDGHIASLFPGLSGVHDQRPVIAVRDSPKPPPTRISLTYPVVGRARQVWFVVAGADKAGPVQAALSGAEPEHVPAAGARGTERTLWLVDAAAASQLAR